MNPKVKLLLQVCLGLAIYFGFVYGAVPYLQSLIPAPANLRPGDPVIFVLGGTRLIEGEPCRDYMGEGKVSLTSPDGQATWHLSHWPWGQYVSVIMPDGKSMWVPVEETYKVPVDPALHLCPTPN
jgi:hypothetical protein